MGAMHSLCVTLRTVATEMALCVLGYNLTRMLNIVGMKPLLAVVRA
jgi:transposase